MSMKDAYQKKMEAQLKEWSAKIDVLKAKADKAGAEQKIKYNEMIESLRARQGKVREKLDKLRASSGTAWEEVRGSVEHAWDELKNAVERAGKKFK
ncbi:MAG: coiled coil domain-containing protein [Desulfobulbaceae bacterium]|nr:hypothetical protein [Desulfobulbaceae bacterium]MDY0352117.1 coiled coil domain-containing protein [Desulfobulbaceae bacterium]